MTARPEPSKVLEAYRARHSRSLALWERSRRAIPGGVTHDSRHLPPFPVYVERASGSRKWDVDGHEYVDYWMGHGALLLGHCHPAVVAAIQGQAARGTHLGACHELEVRWAELVVQLVPSAELVRFTMSGTEATHLALRLARAHTGRPKVVKFTGHFHGWHDGVAVGVHPPYEVPFSAGIPEATLDQVLLSPPNDLKAVEGLFERGDVAAVILEPGGGQAGTTPFVSGFLQELRTLTRQHHVVLIFDEVITGFRYAPGGAQSYFGVTPDLTTLAKIVAGGLPGGAAVGKREIMQLMAHRGDPAWDRSERVAQQGTFNANPLSAAAGIATLGTIADGSLQARANKLGEELRSALSEVMKRVGAPGAVFGEASIYHVSFEGRPGLAGFDRPRRHPLYHVLRCALLNNGVDCSMFHGWISAVHTEEDLALTVQR
ncbi:MAG: aminotransferase class III-fold pyridoxal phosphate-dependent enzyme, partial [Candidatus Rokubacteria bacterium]|nr:aminotransferase class III-fold pyridoxal phosphate-dependent enzyme [Candidatus Rokubacteria bacterium]